MTGNLFDDLPEMLSPSAARSQFKHDPGGSKRYPLPAGMTGSAEFSECGRYRPILERRWGEDERFALWIGMNPSTASEEFNDPTVAKEIDITRDVLGLQRFIKMNVLDYRATDPSSLQAPGVIPRSDRNLPLMIDTAKAAEITILTIGNLDGELEAYTIETINALRAAGVQLHCLAVNKSGAPKHSLYMAKTSVPMPYPTDLMLPQTS